LLEKQQFFPRTPLKMAEICHPSFGTPIAEESGISAEV